MNLLCILQTWFGQSNQRRVSPAYIKHLINVHGRLATCKLDSLQDSILPFKRFLPKNLTIFGWDRAKNIKKRPILGSGWLGGKAPSEAVCIGYFTVASWLDLWRDPGVSEAGIPQHTTHLPSPNTYLVRTLYSVIGLLLSFTLGCHLAFNKYAPCATSSGFPGLLGTSEIKWPNNNDTSQKSNQKKQVWSIRRQPEVLGYNIFMIHTFSYDINIQSKI